MRLLPFLLAQAVALTWTPSPTPNATTTVNRDGVAIASGLTTAAYTDSAVLAGSTHTYYLTASAPGLATSVPSNTYTAVIPAQLIGTTLTLTTSTVSTYLTKVTATVTAASGKIKPSGPIVFVFTGPAGSVTFTTTLNSKGAITDIVATEALRLVPLSATYQGNSTFAASTATIQ